MRKQTELYRRVHAMGAVPVGRLPMGAAPPPVAGPAQQPTTPAPRESPVFPGFVEVPAFYTATIILGGAVNDQAAASVQIRPEMFALRRITWCSDMDLPPYAILPGIAGRTAEITWGDEFTNFLGNSPTLLAALFGDSNGFLDLPGDGILFQGRQSLNAKLKRISWPTDAPATPTRWDINFQGVGLLPARTGGVSGGL
jgi:hypothetical protein